MTSHWEGERLRSCLTMRDEEALVKCDVISTKLFELNKNLLLAQKFSDAFIHSVKNSVIVFRDLGHSVFFTIIIC